MNRAARGQARRREELRQTREGSRELTILDDTGMPFRRITILRNHRLSPTGFELQRSSRETAWAGFPVELHESPESGCERDWQFLKPQVVLHTGHSDFHYREHGGASYDTVFEPDTLSILPQGYEASFSWQGALRFMVVELDEQVLDGLRGHRDAPLTRYLTAKHAFRDRQLCTLLRCIEAATQSSEPLGSLYSESLSMALAVYLSDHYSAKQDAAEHAAPAYRLSRADVRRLLEHIHENLDSDLRLHELAGVVNLSPNYFCQLFRETFGISPHQYVLKERVELAKQMLTDNRMSIAEIASRLGFATQSHFTSVFRRHTGTTPRLYRMH